MTVDVQWAEIDTVLLDMDGTLLDLNYDNVLWNERLPQRYAEHHGLEPHTARDRLHRHFDATRHTIEHYCLDYWTRFTQLNLLALHRELTHLIRYRAHAESFLERLRASGRQTVLVTNAHRVSLGIKDESTGLTKRLDRAISAHDFQAPKEAAEFWQRLATELQFDPARTVFIDDNAAVLDAARRHGVETLLTISQPDSTRPLRADLAYPAFNTFDEIMP